MAKAAARIASQTAIDKTKEPVKTIRQQLDEKLAAVGRIAQIVIFMDSVGTIRAEMPADNGGRKKIELDQKTFRTRNPELVLALHEELERRRIQDEKIAALKAAEAAKRPQEFESEFDARNRALAEQGRKRREWLDSLPKDQREIEEAKLVKKLQEAVEKSNARAHSQYYYVSEYLDIRLAERAYPPERRPNRKVWIELQDGRIVPGKRAGDTVGFNAKKGIDSLGARPKRTKKSIPVDLTKAIEL